jgi:GNAT superfamily N-acetyltransferase
MSAWRHIAKMNPDTLHPVRLDSSWIPHALLLSREAGWNQSAEDWAIFIQNGTVLGFTDGDRLVATAATIPYGEAFAWVSMVLVTATWRRHGLATRLVEEGTAQLQRAGRAALLDAAPAATSIYAGMGYVPLASMQRWEGPGGEQTPATATLDLDLDRAAFGADRRFLLEDFLARPGSGGFRSENGFAILRCGDRTSQIGPIVAKPGEELPLLDAAIRAATGHVVIDVLDTGRTLLPRLHELGFRQLRPFTRMAIGLEALPGNPSWLMAAAGPEFG